MLQLSNVSRWFEGLAALQNVQMNIERGKVTGLIGPNGAGKTTLINCISGLDHPSEGQIIFDGIHIEKRGAHRIAAFGLARTYQNIRLFSEMTTLENIVVAQHLKGKSTLFHSIFQIPSHRREENRIHQQAMDVLESYGLTAVAEVRSSTLSYGDQRRLEMARALITDPKMVLLDEPTAGMNPIETEELGRKILAMRDQGITVLVVEHDMSLISQVCDYVYVLNFGTILTHGMPEDVKKDLRVIEAYLGTED